MSATAVTPQQQRALDLARAEGSICPRRLAGEYGTRAQDAGRTIASLERRGLLRFHAGERPGDAGYRVVEATS